MTCGSKEKINNQDKTKQTLGKSDIKSSHAFSLVSLVNDGSIKAIKLWNPWGKSVYYCIPFYLKTSLILKCFFVVIVVFQAQ
jgi:hypothetical protein